MAERLKRSLDWIDKFRRKRNTDWVVLLVGETGTGKTNVGAFCCDHLSKGRFSVSNVSHTPVELIEAITSAERYSEILDDEGMKDKMSRRAMSTENIEQLSTFAQARQRRNLITFVVVQNLALLDKPLKANIARTAIRCMFRRGDDGFPVQGKIQVFGPKGTRRIKVDKDGIAIFPKPNYVDYVPDMSKYRPELWNSIDTKSGDEKEDSLERSVKKIRDKFVNHSEIKRNVEMDILNLHSKRKSIRKIQVILKKKYKEPPSVSTICRLIKKSH